jgi:hypothetical protein
LSSEVRRRRWLVKGYTEKGPSRAKRKIIPGILDSSVDGKALSAIEFIVSHLVGVGGHSGIVGSQRDIVLLARIHTSEQGRGLRSCEHWNCGFGEAVR